MNIILCRILYFRLISQINIEIILEFSEIESFEV